MLLKIPLFATSSKDYHQYKKGVLQKTYRSVKSVEHLDAFGIRIPNKLMDL